MFSHTPLALLGALSFLSSFSSAHHMLTNIHISGVDQGDGDSVRVPPNTNPVVNVQSPEMACNVGGGKPLDKFVSLDAGSNVILEWRTWPDGSQNTPVDASHQGPCAVYMKRVTSFASDSAAGYGWFKVWHDGYSNGQFCTERLRSSGGIMSFTVPKDLAGGYYIIRGEHLALHQAQTIGGAQWYIGCIQVAVFSTGGSARPSGVSIPGYVSANHPGVLYDYWNNMHPNHYSIPGPEPYEVTSAGGGRRVPSEFPQKYPNCTVSNADWCDKPIPGFTSEAKCWSASEDCWEQLNTCYNTAPATGHKGCTRWEAYCEACQEHCHLCGAAQNCRGKFPAPSREPSYLRVRAEHGGVLLPPIPKGEFGVETVTHHKSHIHKHIRRATTPEAEPTPTVDKLTQVRNLCSVIYRHCIKDNALDICSIFTKACRGTALLDTEKFPYKSDKKWQALWLYQTVCIHENLEKGECRGKFSKVLEGFE